MLPTGSWWIPLERAAVAAEVAVAAVEAAADGAAADGAAADGAGPLVVASASLLASGGASRQV